MSEYDFQVQAELNSFKMGGMHKDEVKRLCVRKAARRMESEINNENLDDCSVETELSFPTSAKLKRYSEEKGEVVIRFYDDPNNDKALIRVGGDYDYGANTDISLTIKRGVRAAARRLAGCSGQLSERQLGLDEL